MTCQSCLSAGAQHLFSHVYLVVNSISPSCLSGAAQHLSCHVYLVVHSISPVMFIWCHTASLLSCLSGAAQHLSCHVYLVVHSISPVMFPCLKNHSFVKTRQKTILAELYQIHHLA
jgi:hypothetical protein